MNNPKYAMLTILMAESKEELNSLLIEMKKENEKAGLKLTTQKDKIMATGPMNSWQIDGEKMETATGIVFLGSQITADDDCSHEIKRCLFLGRKAMTQQLLCHVKKQIHIFVTKGLHSQNYGYPSHAWM